MVTRAARRCGRGGSDEADEHGEVHGEEEEGDGRWWRCDGCPVVGCGEGRAKEEDWWLMEKKKRKAKRGSWVDSDGGGHVVAGLAVVEADGAAGVVWDMRRLGFVWG